MNVPFLQTSNDSRRGFVGRLLDPKLPVERRHFDCNRGGLSHKPVKHLSDKNPAGYHCASTAGRLHCSWICDQRANVIVTTCAKRPRSSLSRSCLASLNWLRLGVVIFLAAVMPRCVVVYCPSEREGGAGAEECLELCALAQRPWHGLAGAR